MGLSRISALEIFTNPTDLKLSVKENNGRFAIFIARGPGHNHKLIASSDFCLTDKDSAIIALKDVLTMICDAITKDNPSLKDGGLTADIVERACAEVFRVGEVETSTLV